LRQRPSPGEASTDAATEAEPAAAAGVRRRIVLHGGLWSAAAEVLPAVGFALLSVIAARILGSSALGRQSLIAYVNVALSAVVVSGLSIAGLRVLGVALGQGDEGLEARLGSWLVSRHVIAGVAIGLVLVAIGQILQQDRLAWAVVGVVAAIDAAVSGITARYAARHGWARLGRMQLVAQLISAPLGIIAVVIGLGIAGIFIGAGIAAAGLLIVMSRRLVPTFTRPPTPSWTRKSPVPIRRTWLTFSTALLLTQIVGRRVEFIVLAIFSTDRQIALYSVAFIVVNLVAMVPTYIAGAAMPMIAAAEGRGELAETTRHTYYAVRLGSLASIPLVAGLCAVGPVAVSVAYGSQYAEAARLVPLASLVLLFAVAGGVCGQYWFGRGRVDVVIVTSGIGAVVDLAVAFALIPSTGALGAIIANLAGQVVAATGLLVYTRRRLGRFGWQRKRALAMAVSCGLGAGSTIAVVVRLTGSIGGGPRPLSAIGALAGGVVLGTAVFSYLAVVLKVVVPSEREWLGPLVPGFADRALAVVSAGGVT
jgi:O-antigen/teichoic acid export membrane protein